MATFCAPPPVSPASLYTSCWCEENIYHLVQEFLESPTVKDVWDIFAVFISNSTKTVALWNQKLANTADSPIVWDYHVILALRPRSDVIYSGTAGMEDIEGGEQSWVYDLDTRLPIPCSWKEYIWQTFALYEGFPSAYQSLFRVVPGIVFIDHFASDRSHMLVQTGQGLERPVVYNSPPPPGAPVCGPKAREMGVTNNLMSDFVSMTESKYGEVLDIRAFVKWANDVTIVTC